MAIRDLFTYQQERHHESASCAESEAVGVIGFCAGSIARADEVLKFRLVMQAASLQTQEVGDVDGHVLGLIRYSGLASFPDGSVGTSNLTATIDYIKGAGTYFTYNNLTLKDGSALWFKRNRTGQTRRHNNHFSEAPVSVLRGTGRFEGAKGDGTGSGACVGPLRPARISIRITLST